MDMISKLPLCIIETILCLLPIQEAARTSILSKEWRYYWIKIPKLAFDEDMFQVSTEGVKSSALAQALFDELPSRNKNIAHRCKLFNAIYQVLLIHEGPIYEFTLRLKVDASCVEIDHVLLHLSKLNTVKILKLDFDSLVHMKHLCMDYQCFTRKYELPFLVFMIRSSPNLEKLNLTMSDYDIYHKRFFTLEDYVDITLEHLNELEILNFSNTENELDFVKLVLAASPVLKKVRILPRCPFDEDEKSQISEILSRAPRASSMVKIQLESSMRF